MRLVCVTQNSTELQVAGQRMLEQILGRAEGRKGKKNVIQQPQFSNQFFTEDKEILLIQGAGNISEVSKGIKKLTQFKNFG